MWEERDRQEQAELAGHANASVTAEEEALPGDFSFMLCSQSQLVPPVIQSEGACGPKTYRS